jgi:ribonuclease P protein component
VSKLGRLRKGREFDQVYREGVAISGPLLVLRCLKAGSDDSPQLAAESRWGFAVGKRLAKLSVDRNHARRRLRQCARSFDVTPGTMFVVTLRPAGLNAPFESLRRGLGRALTSAGVLLTDALP